jgi:hypothetical protein
MSLNTPICTLLFYVSDPAGELPHVGLHPAPNLLPHKL